MSKFPSAYGVYDLTNNFIKSIEGSFRGTGDDTSLTNSKILYIGSAATERMIALTAFIDNYKINLQKKVEELSEEDKNVTFFTDIAGNLSISLSINIPAHSVNESVNNIAKIEELQRLVMAGTWGNNSSKFENISKVSKVNRPLMLVHFANLITNSRAVKSFKINSFKDLLSKGFTCFVDVVSYEPDVEAGFFEFHHGNPKNNNRNFLYPKNIKLTLDLKYESVSAFNEKNEFKNKHAIESFTARGNFKTLKYAEKGSNGEVTGKIVERQVDDGMFPFHSDGIKLNVYEPKKNMSIEEMNEFDRFMDEKIDSFVFIGFNFSSAESEKKAIAAYNNNKNFLSNDYSMKHVFFKPAITNFSRKLLLSNKTNEDPQSLPDSAVFNHLDSSKFKSLEYELSFDVVSASLTDAYKNCGKIQYLMRIFLKKNYSSTLSKKIISEGENISNEVKVYIPSFIESGKGGEYITYDVKQIYDSKAINLQFINLDIDVDMESGFYEDDEKLFPKKIKIKCTFKSGVDSHILGYNYTLRSDTNPQWKLNTRDNMKVPDSWDPSKPYLFPYNRKTVKIGGS